MSVRLLALRGAAVQALRKAKTSGAGVNPKFTLMPAMLKKRGYAAHLVGKW